MSALTEEQMTPKSAEYWDFRALQTNTLTFHSPIFYRKYKIYHNESGWPVGAVYCYVHDDYDGPGDNRLGHGKTVEECIEAINEQILEG